MTANSITDVPGIRVGQAERIGDGWLSGTTVVLPPPAGAVAGVDVRGGAPGTRETDLLDPRNLVDRVHAIVLSGGSALGLASVDGVAQRLFEAGIGYPMGNPGEVVPIVPAAVLFDLGRGGAFSHHPDGRLGEAAYDAAQAFVSLGNHGAGTGARAGGLKGGIGSASIQLNDGTTVGAIVAVNCVGSCVDLRSGELYAARYCLPGDLPELRRPDRADIDDALARAATLELTKRAVLATTIGVIATDARLTKAQCSKVSGIGHDGLARAINPLHTMFDGDTIFTMATGLSRAPDLLQFHALLEAAGNCVTRAVARAMLTATTTTTSWGTMRSYRAAFPSAFAVA